MRRAEPRSPMSSGVDGGREKRRSRLHGRQRVSPHADCVRASAAMAGDEIAVVCVGESDGLGWE